jgi:hypothetical protein
MALNTDALDAVIQAAIDALDGTEDTKALLILAKAVEAIRPVDGGGGGGGGTAVTHLVRADTVGAVNYLGTAPVGTLDSDAAWTITRITLDADGTVATAIATDAAWTNRLTETYS